METLQKLTAEAIVNIFETGRVHGRYGAVTVLKADSGHLSYGRSQAALGSGSLYLLLKAYCEAANARFAGQFIPLLPRFRDKDFSLDYDHGVRELLEQAGEDPVMQQTQDGYFERGYWLPAQRAAAACGLTTALAAAVVYDSHIQGGFGRIRNRVTAGRLTSGSVDETAWISSFLEERRAWLLSCASPLPNTVYRVNEFSRLLAQGNWGLALPLTVRNVVITADILQAAEEPAVAARAPELHTSRKILQLTRPYMRGDDVRVLQTALRTHGFSTETDGTFGPLTEVLVKQFQKKRGLTSDGVVGPATWQELEEEASSAAGR